MSAVMEAYAVDNSSEISQNSDSFEGDDSSKKPTTIQQRYRPTPKRLLPSLPIDLDRYVKVKCKEKIKSLNPKAFHEIELPILIFFNHFREKCAYHIKWLDILYQLALEYGDRIEFIAGDILNIDVINAKWHPIDVFSRYGNPEKASALVYAIDEQKRIHEHVNVEKNYETLSGLCECLLNGCVFSSEPIPEPNNSSLVKICVHDNYKELVTDCKQHVLLIVSLEDYSEYSNENEINCETIAEQLKCYNVDVIYINAEENYVPFELGISSYPSFLFLSQDDKTNYVEPVIGSYTEEDIISSIKSYLSDSKTFLHKRQLELRKHTYQPLNIAQDFKLDLRNLQQYLKENCWHYLQVFDRQAFERTNRFIIIAFMDFENNEVLAHHMHWIDKIYQVAVNLSSPREYFIADFKDIDIINPSWKPKDFIKFVEPGFTVRKVFGIDLNKNKFVLKDFRTAGSLYYFAHSLTNGELYISEPWPIVTEEKLVKTCIADGLNLSIISAKKDIFLAIYYSYTDNFKEFLQLLDEIARELEHLPLKVMKIDARLNCIPLEVDNSMYPIMYFIPQCDKSKRICFPRDDFCKKEIIDFIMDNIEEYKPKN